jgi:hypothetical protein
MMCNDGSGRNPKRNLASGQGALLDDSQVVASRPTVVAPIAQPGFIAAQEEDVALGNMERMKLFEALPDQRRSNAFAPLWTGNRQMMKVAASPIVST